MIKNTILIEIKNILDQNAYLSSTDFEIQRGTKSLKIIYQFDQSYFFEIIVPDSISKLIRTEKETSVGFTTKHKDIEYQAYEFSGSMSPGKISEVERINFEGKQTLLATISEWLYSLWAELTLKPELRRVNQLEEEIQKIKKMSESISEDYFSPEEIITLDQRLSKLEKEFSEKLEAEIDDKNKLEKRVNELHSELQKLRNQSALLNKKNWFVSFASKVMTWLSKEENRKMLKDAKELIDGFIPDK